MQTLPLYISVIFGFTVLLALWFFYKATHRSLPAMAVILLWIGLQSFISVKGFYIVSYTFPPRLALMILPPCAFMILLFITPRGRRFVDTMDSSVLSLLHIIRVPVELVLYALLLYKLVSPQMTIEGWNYDVISGLSAAFIWYFAFVKNKLNDKVLLAWNILCLALLINVVTIAVLSAPTTFQKLSFDQPNVAVLHFPFILLPAFIVPLVLFSHLVMIKKLTSRNFFNDKKFGL